MRVGIEEKEGKTTYVLIPETPIEMSFLVAVILHKQFEVKEASPQSVRLEFKVSRYKQAGLGSVSTTDEPLPDNPTAQIPYDFTAQDASIQRALKSE